MRNILTTLAIIAASIEKFALQVRHWQRTEVREAEEHFKPGQKGSSAMPHKRNPILSERLCGMARVVRGYAVAGLEIGRALARTRHLALIRRARHLAGCLHRARLHAGESRVAHRKPRRPHRTHVGESERDARAVFSGQLLLALTRAGISREEAYEWAQRNAMRAWDEGEDFRALVLADDGDRRAALARRD